VIGQQGRQLDASEDEIRSAMTWGNSNGWEGLILN
jgi:hypothetical protein